MSKKSLQQVIIEKNLYDEESQLLIDSVVFELGQLDSIAAMKNTDGWKILENKLRQELVDRINELIKDDEKVKTLIGFLNVASTKTNRTSLEEQILALLPSE